jgi:N-acetylglucosamine kinase-like BadF-type ATPase
VTEKAHITLDHLTWSTIGITAFDTPKDYKQLSTGFTADEALAKIKNRLTLINDTKIGLYSGTTPPGIAVICGTGSNIYGINSHGEEAMAGNWGHFLGDRGSGYALAQKFFQAVVDAYDGVGESTKLTQKLEARLHVKSPMDIVDWYNDIKPSVHIISDFAPLVLEAAEEGDEVAKQLVDKSIRELGRALKAVVVRLKMEAEPNRVVMCGGLFESKYFRAVFEGHVTAILARVRIIKPLVSQAVGAAIMARHQWEKKTDLKN